MKTLERIFRRKKDVVIADEPTRWQVGNVNYMKDPTGVYFAVGDQVFCEEGPLVHPTEGEAVLLSEPESVVIRRKMGV